MPYPALPKPIQSITFLPKPLKGRKEREKHKKLPNFVFPPGIYVHLLMRKTH